jgi:hypothetical protein
MLARHARKGAWISFWSTAKSAKAADAQALAQANLDGGGNTDENRRAKTPLPPTHASNYRRDIEQMQRRVRIWRRPANPADSGQKLAFAAPARQCQ